MTLTVGIFSVLFILALVTASFFLGSASPTSITGMNRRRSTVRFAATRKPCTRII